MTLLMNIEDLKTLKGMKYMGNKLFNTVMPKHKIFIL